MNKNKTILIIGAKSDIALAVAHKFASEGYNLQLAARNSSELEILSKDFQIRYQVDVSCYELDILKYGSFKTFIGSLNTLPEIVLCAVGVLGNQKNDEKSIANSSLVMRTNYEGPSLLLAEIANHLEKSRQGSIIGISSVAGDRGRANTYIYGSAKAGFTAFLSGLRNRLYESNVNVLTVSPGFVRTKMTEGLELPDFITASPKKVANLVFKNSKKSKAVYVFPWRMIMMIISNIPEYFFKGMKI
jgi:hypothetical protein